MRGLVDHSADQPAAEVWIRLRSPPCLRCSFPCDWAVADADGESVPIACERRPPHLAATISATQRRSGEHAGPAHWSAKAGMCVAYPPRRTDRSCVRPKCHAGPGCLSPSSRRSIRPVEFSTERWTTHTSELAGESARRAKHSERRLVRAPVRSAVGARYAGCCGRGSTVSDSIWR